VIVLCGRYTTYSEEEIIEIRAIIAEVSKKFGYDAVVAGEVFPTNKAPVLTLEEGRISPVPISWGFPKWDGKGVVINARSESALQKPLFSKPILSRRCVIPSAGFFEWTHFSELGQQLSLFSDHEAKPSAKDRKTKLLFRLPGIPMLYMAGMIDSFVDKEGNRSDAFCILTTAANSYMSPFYDRMPVILAEQELDEWINNETFMREVLAREGPELEWLWAG